MSHGRALVALAGVVAAALLLVSGRSGSDPETPTELPGMPPPFLGVAVVGDGEMTAAVDAYGNVVDLRAEPAGEALIENLAERQATGTVPEDTGIQVWARIGGEMTPFWRADVLKQSYLPGTNALRTVARFGRERVETEVAAIGERLAVIASGGTKLDIRVDADIACRQERDQIVSMVCSNQQLGEEPSAEARTMIAAAVIADRRWLERARPLGASAPAWAQRMYDRSLLVLHTLTTRDNGAVAAGARDGWAYVWPRDAAAVAIALADAGYQPEAQLIVRFLLGLGLEQAARFNGDGSPVPGRDAQGDAIGWVAAASQAAGTIGSARHAARILSGRQPISWRNRADYWEGEPGDYLGNAIAARADVSDFMPPIWGKKSDTPPRALVREARDPGSGLDSAAAWVVRPFSRPSLYPAARATLDGLLAERTPYGITPGDGWPGGDDPWSAPTTWTAWSLAALGDREQALQLMKALRRSATPAGTLPERVDAVTGIPTSTTPLAWSHAFAILALRELWPDD